MADTSQLEAALVKADAAGDTAGAKALADAIRQARSAPSTVAQVVPPAINKTAESRSSSGYPIDSRFGFRPVPPPITPTQLVSLGVRGAPPAIGQAVGAATGPFAPAMIPILGAAGGVAGELAGDYMEGRVPTLGSTLGSAAAGAIPGAPLEGAGTRGMMKEVGKNVAGNLAANTISAGIDEKRSITPREAFLSMAFGTAAPLLGKYADQGIKVADNAARKLEMSIPDKNITEGLKAGFVLSPEALSSAAKIPNVGNISGVLQSVGGLRSTNGDMILHNQKVLNGMAAEAMGLPAGTPLQRAKFIDLPNGGTGKIPSTPEMVRARADKVYDELSTMADQAKKDLETLDTKNRLTAQDAHEYAVITGDPQVVKERAKLATAASADVNELRDVRFKQKEAYQRAVDTGDPAAWTEANGLREKAEGIEDNIQKAASEIGNPYLANELVKARKLMAISHAVENAMVGNGDVSPQILGKMRDEGVPLTGPLALAADFEESVGKVMRDAAKAPSTIPDAVRASLAMGSSIAGGFGGLSHGAPGAMLGSAAGFALPYAAQQGAKALLASPWYQRVALTPSSLVPRDQADLAAEIARMSVNSVSRGPNPFLERFKKPTPTGQPPPYLQR